jgi:integrase
MQERKHGHQIEKASVRGRLAPRNEPYWNSLGAGRAIGFRKSPTGAGTWNARWTEPARAAANARQKYVAQSLGSAQSMGYADAVLAAQHFFDEQETEWKNRTSSFLMGDMKTVADACRRYVANMRVQKGDIPANNANGYFESFVYEAPIGQIPLKELTALHVESWRNALVTPKRQKITANRIFRQFAAAMTYAKQRGKLKDYDIWRGVGEFDVVPTRRTGYLEEYQRRAILDAFDREKDQREIDATPDMKYCNRDTGNFIRALMFTGARPGEMARAKVSDFKPKDRELTLLSFKNKKGVGRTRKFFLYEPAALEFFERMARDKLPGAYLLTRADGSSWIYDTEKLKGLPKAREWGGGMRAAIREANKGLRQQKQEPIAPGTVTYTARHTVITDMLDEGVESEAVQAVVGTSAVMIAKHYDQNKEERLKKKLARLKDRQSF